MVQELWKSKFSGETLAQFLAHELGQPIAGFASHDQIMAGTVHARQLLCVTYSGVILLLCAGLWQHISKQTVSTNENEYQTRCPKVEIVKTITELHAMVGRTFWVQISHSIFLTFGAFVRLLM